MYTGTLAAASNRAHWQLEFGLTDAAGAAVDLSAADIEVSVETEDKCRKLEFTTDNGRVTVASNEATFLATPSEMALLCEGRYRVFIRVTINDVTTQVMAADLPVVYGGRE